MCFCAWGQLKREDEARRGWDGVVGGNQEQGGQMGARWQAMRDGGDECSNEPTIWEQPGEVFRDCRQQKARGGLNIALHKTNLFRISPPILAGAALEVRGFLAEVWCCGNTYRR